MFCYFNFGYSDRSHRFQKLHKKTKKNPKRNLPCGDGVCSFDVDDCDVFVAGDDLPLTFSSNLESS